MQPAPLTGTATLKGRQYIHKLLYRCNPHPSRGQQPDTRRANMSRALRCNPHPSRGQQLLGKIPDVFVPLGDATRTPHGDSNNTRCINIARPRAMQPAPLTGTEAFIKPPKPPRYRDPWICHLLADVINVHYRGNNAPPHRRAAGFLFDPGPVTGCPPARAPLPGPAERPGPVPARPRAGRPTRWPRCGSARRRTPGTAGLPDAPPAAGSAGPA